MPDHDYAAGATTTLDEPPGPRPRRTERARRSAARRGPRAARFGSGAVRAGDRGARGRRSRRAEQRRTASRRRLAVLVGLAVAGALAAWVAVAMLPIAPSAPPAFEKTTPRASASGLAALGGDPQPTLVLATVDDRDPGAGASHVAVLAYDGASREATALLVPRSVIADVPGRGMLPLGAAYASGDDLLLDATLDNLLGVDFDHTAGISRGGWAALTDRLGGLALDPAGGLRPDPSGHAAAAGTQLDAKQVAQLVAEERGGSELDALTDVQRVLEALLTRLAADATALDAVFADGAPVLATSSDPGQLRALLAAVADAHAAGDLTVRTLPVRPMGSGEQRTYRLDRARADRLVANRLAASIPRGHGEAGRRVQILNGNGVPGIGQEVAATLVPEGFTVALTRNADRFHHDQTRIIVASDDEPQARLGQQVRDLLGVGRLEVSATPQSVADITVVVGRDYLPASVGG